jgi:hypothetical protein
MDNVDESLLGKRVKVGETTGTIIIIDIDHGKKFAIATDDNSGSYLGKHVTKKEFGVREFRCVNNIAEYHGHGHCWIINRPFEIMDKNLFNRLKIIPVVLYCLWRSKLAEANQSDGTFKCYSCRTML